MSQVKENWTILGTQMKTRPLISAPYNNSF